jgi:hypothetical protein
MKLCEDYIWEMLTIIHLSISYLPVFKVELMMPNFSKAMTSSPTYLYVCNVTFK